jgi:hypothetical protein
MYGWLKRPNTFDLVSDETETFVLPAVYGGYALRLSQVCVAFMQDTHDCIGAEGGLYF